MNKTRNDHTLTIQFLIWAYIAALVPLNFELSQLFQIQQDLGVSAIFIKKMVAFYWLMFALGQGAVAYGLNRYAAKQITRWVVLGYILSFFCLAMAYHPSFFIIGRLGQGFFSGALILMGRYSLSSRFGQESGVFLNQFVNIGIGITMINAIMPTVGGYMGTYLHWRLIYVVMIMLGLFLWAFLDRVFIFQPIKQVSARRLYQTLSSQQSVVWYAVLCGLSRAMIINFNIHMLFYLIHHHQWHSIEYGYFMFCLSVASVLCRSGLKSLKKNFSYEQLQTCIIIIAFMLSSVITVFPTMSIYIQVALMGSAFYVGFSLLATLYSVRSQFILSKKAHPAMFSLMGVTQMMGMSLGTYLAIWLNPHHLSALILMSWCFFSVFIIINLCLINFAVKKKSMVS